MLTSMPNMRSLALATAALAAVGQLACSQPAGAGDTSTTSAANGPQKPRLAHLRDGVLAEARGERGDVIRVEQKGGRRLLIIGDTVHARVAWTVGGPDPSVVDPLVELLHAVRPRATTALVIGLGSGRTAMDLRARGLAVTAVEIEPMVIDMARKHFGFDGEAIAGDGLTYLKETGKNFDIIILDAFDGDRPPEHLVTGTALSTLVSRLTTGGVAAIRLWDEPASAEVIRITKSLRRAQSGMSYAQLFGSGIGGERQALYLVQSAKPINLVVEKGAAPNLWPIAGDAQSLASMRGQDGAERTVTIAGYLHTTDDGELAIDLPHQEMGAVRFLLAGEATAGLKKALGGTDRFPTQGDISSDGSLDQTLRPVLGGGGVRRNEVRFSPVMAAVTGKAELVAVIHPDAALKVPESVRGDAQTDPRVPYGGALYRLELSDVLWTVDFDKFTELYEGSMKDHARAAADAAQEGRLSEAGKHMAELGVAFDQAIGTGAELIAARRAVAEISEALKTEAERAAAKGHDFAWAAACDRIQHRFAQRSELLPIRNVLSALRQCAIGRYIAVARAQGGAYGYDAAARLMVLLDPLEQPHALPRAEAKRRERIRRELAKRHKARPMQFPPGSVE